MYIYVYMYIYYHYHHSFLRLKKYFNFCIYLMVFVNSRVLRTRTEEEVDSRNEQYFHNFPRNMKYGHWPGDF